MTNVITLNVPTRRHTGQAQTDTLVEIFAQHRRLPDDVFWLKENAELLNILECTGADVSMEALSPHANFYQTLPKRLSFFPQYYRFLLSLCLDMEDLGWDETQGEELCTWVSNQELVEAELSDLQRAEARRLLARRGVACTNDEGLTERLHRFIDRAKTFALPNKKAAYELTHIVFYLSEYGRCDPNLSASALRSLRFSGVLAYLDQNADLLAEVCVALRYAGQVPPSVWEDWVLKTLTSFQVTDGPDVDVADDYHMYFVSGWLSRISQGTEHNIAIPAGRLRLSSRDMIQGPLRKISACMFQMDDARTSDWDQMRPILEQVVDETGCKILHQAEQSITDFEDFFHGFSRMSFAG